MNSLYTCSWGKNVAPLYNEDWAASVFDIITEAKGKRGKEAAPGYARLMSLKDIKNLAGTMTPRYFATKVLKQLSQDHPEVDIKDITEDDLLSAMNLVAQLSRKLQMRGDITLSTDKGDASASPSQVQKGDTPFDTLNLNIDPEAMLTFDKETPAGYSTYIVNKNGLKYNVTLKVADGQPVKLKDLDKDNVASLQVTNPKQKETVSLPTAGDTDAPKIEREKLVADFPGGKEDDFSGPDPEDVAHGRKAEDDEQMQPLFGGKEIDFSSLDIADIDGRDYPDFSDAHVVYANFTDGTKLTDEELEMLNNNRQIWDDKVMDHASGMGEEENESPAGAAGDDCEVHAQPMVITIRQSPQSINKHLRTAFRNKMQDRFTTERRNTFGY